MNILNEHVCIYSQTCIKRKTKETICIINQKKTLFSDEQLSLSSPKPTENYLHHIRSSNNFIYQRVTPKILSRQTSVSPLSIETPMTSRNLSRLSRGSQICIT